MKRAKYYTFIFEDRNGNELTRQEAQCRSLTEARRIAKTYKATSQLNDLHKIVVRKSY